MARRQVRTNAVPLYQDFVSIRSDSRCRNCFSSILNGFPFFSALASRNALRCDVSWKSFSDGQPFFVAQFSFLRHILFIAKKKKMLHQITLVYPDVFFAPITIHAATFEKFRRTIHYLWNCYFKLRLRKHRRILESNSLCQLTNYRSRDSCDNCIVRDGDREIPFSSHRWIIYAGRYPTRTFTRQMNWLGRWKSAC